MLPDKKYRSLAFVVALLAWTGLALQFYTSVPAYLAKGRTLGGTLVELFSYFTIQTNLLLACATTAVVIYSKTKTWLNQAGLLTAVAVCISIVSLVYNLVLRQAYHPVGLARISDELMHLLTPIAYVVFWILAVPKQSLTYKGGLPWLLYPLSYLIYILVRGALTNIYPYFFLDAGKFGYGKVAINIAVLMLVFFGIDAFYVFIGRLITRRNQAE
ncbi:hypothetical protein FPZ43_15990 [Mucilaginibacter pallidiroseus]|uniref:FAR-17a/AIG1-like protein n=1 Tax=Mucilaginibacter pallidiroseus TaxID=2599295 RepID=A0A563U367_9SPHI|nr:Pr6Pr family membrane protein [Mucilaginibacter pallidiroseus]TWR25784.1 hypothetical protein FPZ43_15990 [Mucilaginibacter pallidiroseus]